MIVYAESSAILRWLFLERHGEAVFARLRDADKVICSRLSLIECRRVIRRAMAEGRIHEVDARERLGILAQAATHWTVIEISRSIARRAEESFPTEPVRTLDAIHLASALVLRESLPVLVVMSTDDRLRRNALQLGFPLFPDEPVSFP